MVKSGSRGCGLAFAKILLGNMRTTYTGVTLPGGGSVDGQTVLSQGTAERDKLREELLQKFPSFGIWIG